MTRTYDANGMRTQRTNGTTTYTYVYNGSQLTGLTVNCTAADGTVTTHTMRIGYDSNGPMYVKYNGSTYQYVTNLQGDVIALLNSAGAVVVEYTYDAWGNILSMTGSLASTLGEYNPLRYRGYVYDTETGLYYLQSRYCNPELGRFINADVYAATGQGLLGNNMFAYCLNNPVCFGDFTGEDAVVLYDEDFVGHIGVLVQNENGEWWHFYWGGFGLLGQLASVFGFNVIAESWCVGYAGDPTSLEEINNCGQYDSYEEMHYMEGDFSDTVEMFQNMGSLYNLYENNCSIVSLRTLASADTSYKGMLKIASKYTVPAHANKFIRNNINKHHPNKKFSPYCCVEV